MGYVTSCRHCENPIELKRLAKTCPICNEIIFPEGLGERRKGATVPFVRDWVTALRFSGGDFNKLAARLTLEFAESCRTNGMSARDVFTLARDAYYRA